jgi:hypothetical protein
MRLRTIPLESQLLELPRLGVGASPGVDYSGQPASIQSAIC